MRYTAQDIVEHVRWLCAGTPASAVSDEAILAHATAVLHELAARVRPHELVREVSSTPDPDGVVVLPSDYIRATGVFFEDRRLREIATVDIPELGDIEGDPEFWCAIEPERTPPYSQRIRVLPYTSGEVQIVYVGEHPPLVLTPYASPVLLGQGWWTTITEQVASRVMLGLTLGQVQQNRAAGTEVRQRETYQRASRQIGQGRPGRVGGAIVPKRRRRSVW